MGSHEDFGCFIATLFPIKDNLAGHPATHDIEAFLEVINLVVMGDDRRKIQARLNQRSHYV